MRKDEDLSLCTTRCNDETDTTKCLASLSKATPFNPGIQSTKATTKSKWISLIAATKKTPNKMNQSYGVPTMYRPAPSASSSYPSPRLCSTRVYIMPVFMLSTPGEELGFSFGIWRWKTEYWSILADQVLTTIKVLVPSFFLWYSICLQLYTEPLVVAVPIWILGRFLESCGTR